MVTSRSLGTGEGRSGGDRSPAARLSTAELLDELEHRSLGCLCVCVRVEEGRGDVWAYRLRGSAVLLGAMTAAASLRASKLIAARGDAEKGEW